MPIAEVSPSAIFSAFFSTVDLTSRESYRLATASFCAVQYFDLAQ
jgi:hypothetical protein